MNRPDSGFSIHQGAELCLSSHVAFQGVIIMADDAMLRSAGSPRDQIMQKQTPTAVGFGVMVGLLVGYSATARTTPTQDTQQVLVDGRGRAISSLRPPGEPFILHVTRSPEQSFKVVPSGKNFVLTDVVYIAQGSLRQDAAVNFASADPVRQTHEILFQVRISPGESHDVHLCSGYVIPAGRSLVAFTNAGLAPEQYISVAVTGYIASE